MAEPITIRARFDRGVFVPEEPVNLPEGTIVTITFFPDPAPDALESEETSAGDFPI
jgi:predicted DNA-binding antitoxin AbrB/MazE fold protein